ncbi:MAG: NAD(P)-binding protein [Pseudonocardiaceae bacterium]
MQTRTRTGWIPGDVALVDYDVVVVGSGFGGSIEAPRLTEKGYRVGVFEAGRRFADEELATGAGPPCTR